MPELLVLLKNNNLALLAWSLFLKCLCSQIFGIPFICLNKYLQFSAIRMRFSQVEVILLLFEMAIFLKFDATFSASHNLCCDIISMTCSVVHTQDEHVEWQSAALTWR